VLNSDKGSAVVIMDRQQYIDETMKHLNNRTNYAIHDSNPTDSFSQQIQTTVDDMYTCGKLTDKAHNFLSPAGSKAARFYLFPKIHKPGNTGHPSVSSNGFPTENISFFVDHFIKPVVPQAPSYINPDFIRKLESIKNQTPNTAIITALFVPVTSLYTNIPFSEGIVATGEDLTKSDHIIPPIDDRSEGSHEPCTNYIRII
jgi:hypothetical protein